MGMGNNKLFEIRVKGINRGNLARNSSPGVTYVVSSSMDKAYNAMRMLYGSDSDYTDAKDFELESIRLVADESNPNTCETDTYKLILADKFFEMFSKDKIIDIKAVADFVAKEKEENGISDNDNEKEEDDENDDPEVV